MVGETHTSILSMKYKNPNSKRLQKRMHKVPCRCFQKAKCKLRKNTGLKHTPGMAYSQTQQEDFINQLESNIKH